MRARKPPNLVAKASTAKLKLELPTPTIVLSRRVGRFEVRETVRPGVEPADLEGPLDKLTKTGRVERRLARLDLYIRALVPGEPLDEAFFGVGIFLDVTGHPWANLCELDAHGRPIRLKAALHEQLGACVEAYRNARRGRRAPGKGISLTRAEHFCQLAATLGLVSPKADPASVRRMVRSGKRALTGEQ